MICYNNRSKTAQTYVELLVSPTMVYVRRAAKPQQQGWSVHSNVFSHDRQYDQLVDLSRNFLSEREAQKFAEEIAQKFGLTLDANLHHRRSLFAVGGRR